MKSTGESFYVVDTFDNAYQAELVKALLADFEIKSEVMNVETNILYPFISDGSFDVKLVANIEDREKIDEVLRSNFVK